MNLLRVTAAGVVTQLGPTFFAYDAGRVRVATADFDSDGTPEVITAPEPGGGPHVRIFKIIRRRGRGHGTRPPVLRL